MSQVALKVRFRLLRSIVSANALILVGLLTPAAAASQLIAVRTLPIADADQFSFFPSRTAGMGGVRIAIADSVHDPFVNPATGARLRRPLFFSAPSAFSVSGDAGRGSTYPLGALARSGATFGGAAVAIQSISDAAPLNALAAPSSGDSRSNRYGFVMLGHTLGDSRLSVGASALWSDLGSIDGTSLLYADSRSVQQAGRAADVRVGALKEWNGGHSLEAVVFNRRIRMTHDVTYGDLYWDPLSRGTVIRDRLEHERDRTNVWGVHVEYARPVGDSGWRAGVILTANRLDNPNRPAYEIETLGGSRGRAAAFNIGVGVARSLGTTTLAADAIYEPIWSRIWGGASDTAAATSAPVAGGSDVDNRLRFSNAVLRTGVSHDLTLAQDSKLQLQFGIQARSIYYTLDQRDLVSGSTRASDRSWMEWTRGWGATVRRGAVELNYFGRKTSGAGRPGIDVNVSPPGPVIGGAFDVRAPIPSPATTLRDVSVMTHQLSISLAIR